MERKLNEILERLERIEKDVKAIKREYDYDHSTESDIRDFAINVAANLVGNSVKTPVFLNLNPQQR